MKVSHYNVFCPVDDTYILFNTLTNSILLVDSQAKDILEENDLSCVDKEFLELFWLNGIIVDGNEKQIQDSVVALESVNNYLNNPAIESLEELNANLSKLSIIPYEEMTFLKRSKVILENPKIRLPLAFLGCVVLGAIVFFFAQSLLDMSKESSFAPAIATVFGSFTVYLTLTRK